MAEKYTLIASRNEEDRTKMIIMYANINPTSTLILSRSYTKEWIYANTKINKMLVQLKIQIILIYPNIKLFVLIMLKYLIKNIFLK